MSSVTHFPLYGNYFETPEDGRRKLATCPTCDTDFYGEGPEYENCFACGRLVCRDCNRHRCDGCDLWFCDECLDEVNDSGGDGLKGDNPLWLCAECKVEHFSEFIRVDAAELARRTIRGVAANQVATMEHFYHLAQGGAA